MSIVPKIYTTWTNNTDKDWWKDPSLRRNVFHCSVLFFCVFSIGYDGSVLNGLQAIKEWVSFFHNPTGTRLGALNAAYYFPKIVVAPLIGSFIADKYGRKITVAAAALIMFTGAIVGCFSTGIRMYAGSRVILGCGTSWAVITGPAYMAELAHPRYRAKVQGVFYACYYVGSILSAWLTFGMTKHPGLGNWTWRLPLIFQGLGPLILFFGIWFLPESPRYLMKIGKEDQALAILASEHGNGNINDELVAHEMKEIKASLREEVEGRGTGWAVFVQGRANRRRLAAVAIIAAATQLAGNGIISYYLAPALRQVGITSPEQITGINGGLAIFNLFVALLGSFLIERFGRRALFLVSCSGMIIMYAGMTGVSAGFAKTKKSSLGIAVVPFMYLFYFFYSIALTPLPTVYLPEIYSSSMRVRATGIYSTIQSISLAFNVFVNPIALAAITWKCYLVYVATLICFWILIFFFVLETKGLTVEAASKVYDFDGDRFAAVENLEQHTTAFDSYGSHTVKEDI